jgi:anti-anti-sigma regulatory factor
LTEATVETLQRELELLAMLHHRVLTLELANCRFGDLYGMLGLLEVLQQMGEDGHRLAIVAGTGWIARLLNVAGLDRLLPVFPTEEEAARALTLAVPKPLAPATWPEARRQMVACWRGLRESLDDAPTEEILRTLTMMMPLCERAEEFYQRRARPAAWRCQFCPLFETLGRRPQDVGCRSLLDPIITAVRAGERGAARDLVDQAIRLLEEMPLPKTESSISGQSPN